MLEVHKDNFEKEVLQEEGLVLVDFWGPQCIPCKQLMPELVALAQKLEGQVKFCKLNVAENRRLAISQKVLGLPAVLLFKGGEKIAEFSKDFDAHDVETKLMELISKGGK
jgi:thioredoxin 1